MQDLTNIVKLINEPIKKKSALSMDELKVMRTALYTLKKDLLIAFESLDLQEYNEKLRVEARSDKIKNIESQNFEKAAHYRDIEKTCEEARIERERQFPDRFPVFRITNQKLIMFYHYNQTELEKQVSELIAQI